MASHSNILIIKIIWSWSTYENSWLRAWTSMYLLTRWHWSFKQSDWFAWEVDNLRSETIAGTKLPICGSDRGRKEEILEMLTFLDYVTLSLSLKMLIHIFSSVSVNNGLKNSPPFLACRWMFYYNSPRCQQQRQQQQQVFYSPINV